MTNPILVTGATGRHGNTGEYLVRRLREAGHPVRILTRRRSERTEQLAALGAEIAVGDLHDRRTLVPALTGRAPATLREFLLANREAFATS